MSVVLVLQIGLAYITAGIYQVLDWYRVPAWYEPQQVLGGEDENAGGVEAEEGVSVSLAARQRHAGGRTQQTAAHAAHASAHASVTPVATRPQPTVSAMFANTDVAMKNLPSDTATDRCEISQCLTTTMFMVLSS